MKRDTMSDFEGRRALVTGAGAGIGRAIAQRLADGGAAVACVDIDGDAANEVAEDLGRGAVGLTADVGDEASTNAAVDAACDHLGGLDIVVNNVGIVILKGLEESTLNDWDRTMTVNLRSIFLVTRRALPALKSSPDASIVNISSVAALRYSFIHTAYTASKGGVVSLTRETAVELAKYGIRVNSVAPGPVKTEALDGLTDSQLADIGLNFLLGRMCQPADIAEAVAFLASPRAACITGVTLPVTGGVELPTSTAPLPWNE